MFESYFFVQRAVCWWVRGKAVTEEQHEATVLVGQAFSIGYVYRMVARDNYGELVAENNDSGLRIICPGVTLYTFCCQHFPRPKLPVNYIQNTRNKLHQFIDQQLHVYVTYVVTS